jgi:hypothetical protein
VTFSILHVFWISNQLYFKPPQQSRHPERSASRIYRKQELYGAESKDPGDSYPAMLFEAFSATKPENRINLIFFG